MPYRCIVASSTINQHWFYRVTIGAKLMQRGVIEVKNLDAWVGEFLKKQGYERRIAYFGDINGNRLNPGQGREVVGPAARVCGLVLARED
jgi:hypothetical protein